MFSQFPDYITFGIGSIWHLQYIPHHQSIFKSFNQVFLLPTVVGATSAVQQLDRQGKTVLPSFRMKARWVVKAVKYHAAKSAKVGGIVSLMAFLGGYMYFCYSLIIEPDKFTALIPLDERQNHCYFAALSLLVWTFMVGRLFFARPDTETKIIVAGHGPAKSIFGGRFFYSGLADCYKVPEPYVEFRAESPVRLASGEELKAKLKIGLEVDDEDMGQILKEYGTTFPNLLLESHTVQVTTDILKGCSLQNLDSPSRKMHCDAIRNNLQIEADRYNIKIANVSIESISFAP